MSARPTVARFVTFLLLSALLTSAAPLRAQSLLDRPPNLSGEWIAPRGTVQFNEIADAVSLPVANPVRATQDIDAAVANLFAKYPPRPSRG